MKERTSTNRLKERKMDLVMSVVEGVFEANKKHKEEGSSVRLVRQKK